MLIMNKKIKDDFNFDVNYTPVVFVKNHCPKCHFLTQYLKHKDVKFSEINIDKNPEYIDYLKEKGFSELPVTMFGEFEVSGVFTDSAPIFKAMIK